MWKVLKGTWAVVSFVLGSYLLGVTHRGCLIAAQRFNDPFRALTKDPPSSGRCLAEGLATAMAPSNRAAVLGGGMGMMVLATFVGLGSWWVVGVIYRAMQGDVPPPLRKPMPRWARMLAALGGVAVLSVLMVGTKSVWFLFLGVAGITTSCWLWFSGSSLMSLTDNSKPRDQQADIGD